MNKRLLLAVSMLCVAHAQADFLREWVRPAVFHASRIAAGAVTGVGIDWLTHDMYPNDADKKEAVVTVAKIFISAYAPAFINENSKLLPSMVSWFQPYAPNRPGSHAYYVGIGADKAAIGYGIAIKDYLMNK